MKRRNSYEPSAMYLNQSPIGLYFDSRKDKTYSQEELTGSGTSTKRRKIIREEHISLILEPGSHYISHVVPVTGGAKDISQSIIRCLEIDQTILSRLVAVGCDSTAVNTGKTAGVIRLLEEKFSKPLQWMICFLHLNELPLRHIFCYLDGGTSGPQAFLGPIGKALKACEELPIIAFEPIEPLCFVDATTLSTDQRYLIEIYYAVTGGDFPESLKHKNPGNMSHARWLTTANRILRLYASTSQPSEALKVLSVFLVKSYIPMWFDIKTKPTTEKASLHFLQMIRRSRYLPEDIRSVHDAVICRNAYYAHQEHILIAMINDSRQHVRELGFRRILRSRDVAEKKDYPRRFFVSAINLNASDYPELIDWQDTIIQRTEPPITQMVSTADIKIHITHGTKLPQDLFQFPCHSQAVERCVKLVTEASITVCGTLNRDGLIRSTLESRRKLPKVNSKKDFASLF